MKNRIAKLLALLLSVLMLLGLAVPSFAANRVFEDGAYASIVTASDFQAKHTVAYDRFAGVLSLMKEDGLETPHSMLVGGDYTMLMSDNANPGMSLIKNTLASVYPEMDTNMLACVQGNHDRKAAGFTKTGHYDMGEYNLYAVNEDDFPWKQYRTNGSKVKKLASQMDEYFTSLIESGDTRPVIIVTHVPLHHTSRNYGADNKYSSYIFDIINKAAETLDIVFLFGHNHSSDYDDYIGGAVNFLAPGDEIRLPDAKKNSKTKYNTATLNFTYANCGYMGYSDNTVSDTSTNALTVGVIRITENSLRFIKYSEDGFFCENEVARKNPGTASGQPGGITLNNPTKWEKLLRIFAKFPVILKMFFAIFVTG